MEPEPNRSPAPESDSATRSSPRSPLGEPTHLYILAAGIVLGVLLGPAVLGRISPDTYRRWFASPHTARAVLETFDRRQADDRQLLEKLDDAQLDTRTLRDQFARDRAALQQRVEHGRAAQGRIVILLILIAALMGLEPLFAAAENAAARLIRARYILTAVALALLLAHARTIPATALWFGLLVAAIAAAATILPARPTAESPR